MPGNVDALGHRGRVALEEKFGRLKQLMDTGKEKGYVLYDEVNELLTEDYSGGRQLDEQPARRIARWVLDGP